jgi:hypothetical protein
VLILDGITSSRLPHLAYQAEITVILFFILNNGLGLLKRHLDQLPVRVLDGIPRFYCLLFLFTAKRDFCESKITQSSDLTGSFCLDSWPWNSGHLLHLPQVFLSSPHILTLTWSHQTVPSGKSRYYPIFFLNSMYFILNLYNYLIPS